MVMNMILDEGHSTDKVSSQINSGSNEVTGVARKFSLKEMLNYAGHGLNKAGYQWQRVANSGRKRVWIIEKDGQRTKVAVRTTQDRWFAFPRKNDGWKTLDEVGVESVVVAAVDDPDKPKNIEIYLFPVDAVRQCFNENYKARDEAGHAIVKVHQGRFGMWIALDRQNSGAAALVGSGLAQDFPAIAIVPVAGAGDKASLEHPLELDRPRGDYLPRTATIADVIFVARRRIAEISGMPFDKVSLELRIG